MREELKTSAGGDAAVWGTVIPGFSQELLIHVMLPGFRIFGFHLRFSGSGPHFLAVWDKFVSVEGALATPDSENSGRRIP